MEDHHIRRIVSDEEPPRTRSLLPNQFVHCRRVSGVSMGAHAVEQAVACAELRDEAYGGGRAVPDRVGYLLLEGKHVLLAVGRTRGHARCTQPSQSEESGRACCVF
ncbi:hypothetical protein SBA2_1000007 [Acidobacteriia bacterium SbA2]|nr:hypothetical protein SBA2_1000007 [Acidobacteriia bacterium SbA2]